MLPANMTPGTALVGPKDASIVGNVVWMVGCWGMSGFVPGAVAKCRRRLALVDRGSSHDAAGRASGHHVAAPVTDYIPGIAAHYLQLSWLDDRFVISEPEFMLYGREGQLVGVAYFVRSGANPPEGFTGTADGWHRHLGLCLSLATLLVIGGDGSDPGDCARRGGFIFGGQEYWLLHAWVVPGFGSPSGVFSGEHPLLI